MVKLGKRYTICCVVTTFTCGFSCTVLGSLLTVVTRVVLFVCHLLESVIVQQIV